MTGKEQRAALVVDDTDPVRRVVSEIVAGLGWTVSAAATMDRARELLRTETFTLVLTDLELDDSEQGREGGLAIIGEIRRRFPETPVILMTSSRDPLVRRRALASGVATVLQKPFGQERLEAAIRGAVDG